MSDFNDFSKKATSITNATPQAGNNTPESKPDQKPTGVPPSTDKPAQPK